MTAGTDAKAIATSSRRIDPPNGFYRFCRFYRVQK
jgi:hypothetical protein